MEELVTGKKRKLDKVSAFKHFKEMEGLSPKYHLVTIKNLFQSMNELKQTLEHSNEDTLVFFQVDYSSSKPDSTKNKILLLEFLFIKVKDASFEIKGKSSLIVESFELYSIPCLKFSRLDTSNDIDLSFSSSINFYINSLRNLGTLFNQSMSKAEVGIGLILQPETLSYAQLDRLVVYKKKFKDILKDGKAIKKEKLGNIKYHFFSKALTIQSLLLQNTLEKYLNNLISEFKAVSKAEKDKLSKIFYFNKDCDDEFGLYTDFLKTIFDESYYIHSGFTLKNSNESSKETIKKEKIFEVDKITLHKKSKIILDDQYSRAYKTAVHAIETFIEKNCKKDESKERRENFIERLNPCTIQVFNNLLPIINEQEFMKKGLLRILLTNNEISILKLDDFRHSAEKIRLFFNELIRIIEFFSSDSSSLEINRDHRSLIKYNWSDFVMKGNSELHSLSLFYYEITIAAKEINNISKVFFNKKIDYKKLFLNKENDDEILFGTGVGVSLAELIAKIEIDDKHEEEDEIDDRHEEGDEIDDKHEEGDEIDDKHEEGDVKKEGKDLKIINRNEEFKEILAEIEEELDNNDTEKVKSNSEEVRKLMKLHENQSDLYVELKKLKKCNFMEEEVGASRIYEIIMDAWTNKKFILTGYNLEEKLALCNTQFLGKSKYELNSGINFDLKFFSSLKDYKKKFITENFLLTLDESIGKSLTENSEKVSFFEKLIQARSTYEAIITSSKFILKEITSKSNIYDKIEKIMDNYDFDFNITTSVDEKGFKYSVSLLNKVEEAMEKQFFNLKDELSRLADG